VIVWLADPLPALNVAPDWGARSWLWLAVVSQTETAGPDAACAAPGLSPAVAPAAMSAAAPSNAVMPLLRDIVVLLP